MKNSAYPSGVLHLLVNTEMYRMKLDCPVTISLTVKRCFVIAG